MSDQLVPVMTQAEIDEARMLVSVAVERLAESARCWYRAEKPIAAAHRAEQLDAIDTREDRVNRVVFALSTALAEAREEIARLDCYRADAVEARKDLETWLVHEEWAAEAQAQKYGGVSDRAIVLREVLAQILLFARALEGR